MNKNNLIFGAAVIVVIVLISAGVWYGLKDKSTANGNIGGVATLDESVPAPSLDREVTAPEYFPQEAKDILLANIADAKGRIEENPGDLSSWLDLAIFYKTAEDYEGAEAIWLYINKAAEGQSISAHNLGDLYHLYLKDYKKAEGQFREALRRNPGQTFTYAALHELYRYSYKTDTNLAVDVIMEGLQVDPGAIDLMKLLAGYYKDRGENAKAIEWFEKARDAADARGNADLGKQMQTEIDALR